MTLLREKLGTDETITTGNNWISISVNEQNKYLREMLVHKNVRLSSSLVELLGAKFPSKISSAIAMSFWQENPTFWM